MSENTPVHAVPATPSPQAAAAPNRAGHAGSEYVDATGAVRLTRTDTALHVATWQHDPVLTLQGPWLADFAADLAAGTFGAQSRARLRAAGAWLPPPLRRVVDAAATGRFHAATPLDFLRRDGFGQLWIELTARCQLHCLHCYAESHSGRHAELPLATVGRVLAEAVALDFRRVQFTGGDPLLAPTLLDAVAEARSHGLDVEVFTNGLALTPKLSEALVARGVSFAFSLYSDRPAEHEAITQVAGSHAATVAAIRRVRAAGAAARVAIILMPQNVARAAATRAFAATLVGDLRRVRVDVQRAVGRGGFSADVVVPSAEPHADGAAAETCDAPLDLPRLGKACVAADGTVYPCIYARWLPLGRLGATGGLGDILARPTPCAAWRIPANAEAEAFAAERLTCPDCRATARFLSEVAHAAPTA